jgi:hypothetical protein
MSLKCTLPRAQPTLEPIFTLSAVAVTIRGTRYLRVGDDPLGGVAKHFAVREEGSGSAFQTGIAE